MSSQSILNAGVRDDLAAAHADTMADLAQAGDWLRADERAAVIRVVRAALADSDQPPWYQPSTERDGFEPLPAAAVDAAWRLTNHSGTLTADWYSSVVEQLPSAEYYVEVVGVVAVMNAIDRLASMLDLDVLTLPPAVDGAPKRPEIATEVSSHWVPTEVGFDGPNVLRALTVSPSVVDVRTRIGAAHYMTAAGRADLDWTRGTLDRRQIELVAGVTSMHNECFY